MSQPGDGERNPFTGGMALTHEEVEEKKRRIAILRQKFRKVGLASFFDHATKHPGDIAAGEPFTPLLPPWTKM